jgi:hypothetical protein
VCGTAASFAHARHVEGNTIPGAGRRRLCHIARYHDSLCGEHPPTQFCKLAARTQLRKQKKVWETHPSVLEVFYEFAARASHGHDAGLDADFHCRKKETLESDLCTTPDTTPMRQAKKLENHVENKLRRAGMAARLTVSGDLDLVLH